MKYDAEEFRNLVHEASKYITCKKYAHTENCTCNRHGVPILKDTNDALRCAVEEAERLRNERNNVAGSCLAMRDDIERKEREIAEHHAILERIRFHAQKMGGQKLGLLREGNNILKLLDGEVLSYSEQKTKEV